MPKNDGDNNIGKYVELVMLLRESTRRASWLVGVWIWDGIFPGSAYKPSALELPVVETLNSAIDGFVSCIVDKGAIGL